MTHHPGAAAYAFACAELLPEPLPRSYAVALVGRRRGRQRFTLDVHTVVACDRLHALFLGTLLAERLMPRSHGWRGVKVRVSSGTPADPRRATRGREESP